MSSEPETIPSSREEALRTKRTYFQGEERCTCGSRFRWAHTRECMACNPEYREKSA